MVSRGYYGVFDGDGSNTSPRGPPGSEVIEKLFVDDFVSKGYTVTPAVFSGGSDYAPFMDVLKKPVGGRCPVTHFEKRCNLEADCWK